MTTGKRFKFLLIIALLFGGAPLFTQLPSLRAQEEKHDDHAGHDHAEHEAETKDDHAGHDHAEHEAEKKDDHAGHDHAEHEAETKDDHAGHDHAEHEAETKDDHAGHDHAEHEAEKKDDHAGHDHAEHEAEKKDDHAGHDHAEHEAETKDDHAGHDHAKHEVEKDDGHDDHEGHDAHEEEGLSLTAKQKMEIGFTLNKAGPGNLHREVVLPGEVVLNTDTVVHVVPRVSGIVNSVSTKLGDHVKMDDSMAELDSPELGEAKSAYFEAFNEAGCCKIDLERAKTIEANTLKLLKDLAKSPKLGDLRGQHYGDLGQYRSKLLSAYAERVVNKKNLERKQKLYDDKITSENEFIEARSSFEKAEAEYYAQCDNAQFEIKQARVELERSQSVKEIKLKTAERQLRIMGLSADDIKALQAVNTQPAKSDCTDPNCTDCQAAATVKQQTIDESFSSIMLKSPATGVVIEKHLVTGEKVTGEEPVFTIADLNELWVLISVPNRHLQHIKVGDKVTISATDDRSTSGIVQLISPTINTETRTATVRVVIDNKANLWRPGSFVNGHVQVSAQNLAVVLAKDSVQNIEGTDVVFIPEGHGFKPVPVVTGRSDRQSIEIKSGLKAGMTYVQKGAFELKAKLITSSLGSHAGHGH